MKVWKGLVPACLVALIGCTPGAPPPPAGAQGPVPGAIIIEVSLLKYQPMKTPDGVVAGYNNDDLTVPVGATIQFHNQDNFTHTASSVGSNGFPSGNPLGSSARTPSGSDLAQPNWSSGDLTANAYSQPLKASTAGKYFYGCFFHYNTPMRGLVIVQ